MHKIDRSIEIPTLACPIHPKLCPGEAWSTQSPLHALCTKHCFPFLKCLGFARISANTEWKPSFMSLLNSIFEFPFLLLQLPKLHSVWSAIIRELISERYKVTKLIRHVPSAWELFITGSHQRIWWYKTLSSGAVQHGQGHEDLPHTPGTPFPCFVNES